MPALAVDHSDPKASPPEDAAVGLFIGGFDWLLDVARAFVFACPES